MMRIPLFRRRQITDLLAIVDDDVYPLLIARRWSVCEPAGSRNMYARSKIGGRTVYMHQTVMGEPQEPGLEIGHVDGNGLHNWRGNLRWLPDAGKIQASHDRLPCSVSSAVLNAAHVHAVMAKGRRYFYDRRTRQRLTENEVAERLERTKIERKL
jgi:hypothetical protein